MESIDPPSLLPGWRRGVPPLAAALLLALPVALAIERLAWPGYRLLPWAVAFGAVAILVLAVLPTLRPGERSGAANSITLLRGAIPSGLAGLVGSAPGVCKGSGA